MFMNRVLGPCLVLALLSPVLAGCQGSKSATGSRPRVAVETAPNLADYSVEKVGILGYANTSGDTRASDIARYVDAALGQVRKYFFTRSGAFQRSAQHSEVEAEFSRLVESWEKRLTLTRADVVSLLEATGYDALLVYEVNKWRQEKINILQEGTSDTTVGLRMELYGRDGTLLWSASNMKVAHSTPYLPDLNVKSTVSGEAIYDESRVPEPPAIEPVAQQVVEEIVAELPDFGGGSDAEN